MSDPDPREPEPASQSEPPPEPPSTFDRRRPRGTFRLGAAVLAASLLAVAAWLFHGGMRQMSDLAGIRLTESTVRKVAWTALQRESSERFLVTGRLDVTATTEVEDTRLVLPGILDLSLGTSRATVRVPGRVHYGVDLQALDTTDITLAPDSALVVRLMEIEVAAVEALLGSLEVRTERGWARLPGRSVPEAERRALALLRPVIRQQGMAHLADARQPRVNTARAVGGILLPILEALGLPASVVRVRIGDETYTVRPSASPDASPDASPETSPDSGNPPRTDRRPT